MVMYRNIAISFVGGLGLGAGGCYLYMRSTKQSASGFDLDHPALTHGAPVSEVMRTFKGFVASFDMRTRNPRYVIEHLTPSSVSGDGDRVKSDFFEDKMIDHDLRNKLSDFRGSGYDRGHLAPAADFKGSQEAMDETFTLTNISPQVGEGFNRSYWARFEKWVKDVTRKADDVWVVTGPLWLPRVDSSGKWEMRYPMIGQVPGLVSVPTHFFKVVVARGGQFDPPPAPTPAPTSHSSGNSRSNTPAPAAVVTAAATAAVAAAVKEKPVAVAAFVMPNQAIDSSYPLQAWVVPLDALEQVAGMRFFPELITSEKRRALDEAALTIRASALSQLRPAERKSLASSSPALLALPAPSSASSSASITVVRGSSTSKGAAPPSHGVVHLCEKVAVKLPVDKFWEGGESGSEGESEGEGEEEGQQGGKAGWKWGRKG